VARVYPRLTAEEVIVGGCFGEESIVEVNHASSHEGVPLFSNSTSIARLQLTFRINKASLDIEQPKMVGLVSQFLKS